MGIFKHGKNLFNLYAESTQYPGASNLLVTKNNGLLTLKAVGTAGAQYAEIKGRCSQNTQYTFSAKCKKIVPNQDGDNSLSVLPRYSNNGVNWTYDWGNRINIPSPVTGQEYLLSKTFTTGDYTYLSFIFYNAEGSQPITIGTQTEYYDIQLELGSTATSYEPYTEPKVRHIAVGSGNLLDMGSAITPTANTSIVIMKNKILYNILPIATATGIGIIIKANIKQGRQYKLNLSISNGIKFANVRLSSDLSFSNYQQLGYNTGLTSYDFTSNNDYNYIRFWCWRSSEGGADSGELSNIMLNEGSMVLPYEPYYNIARVYQGDNLVFSDILPDELQECKYIHADGNQYINTGLAYTSYDQIDFKAKADATQAKPYARILGQVYATGSGGSNGMTLTPGAVGRWGKNASNINPGEGVPAGTIMTGSFRRNKLVLNGKTYTDSNPEVDNVPTQPLVLFTTNNINSPSYAECQFTGSIYYVRIYKSGELVHDFIPCYIKTGKTFVDEKGVTCSAGTAGLYDRVNGVFYTNSGTGTFSVGGDV